MKINLIVFLLSVTSFAVELVAELEDADISGQEKFEMAIQETKDFLDKEADFLPLWSSLTEDQRDRILIGIVEFALVLYRKTYIETLKVRKPFLKWTRIGHIKGVIQDVIKKSK